MQQLKAAFQVLGTIATNKLSYVSTDHYDRRNRTQVCLAAE